MKTTILILLLVAFSWQAQSQITTDNGAIVWQNVYNDAPGINAAAIAPKINEAAIAGDLISGTIEGVVNYAAAGAKRSQMPLYMLQPFKAAVTVELKPGRYRVTVSNIQFKELPATVYTESQTFKPLEVFAIKQRTGKIKPGQVAALEVLAADLAQRFTLSETTTNDW